MSLPRLLLLVALILPPAGWAASGPAPEEDDDDVYRMEAFDVTASRLEDFGLMVRRGSPDPARSTFFWPVRLPVIVGVLPNTVASRAGLQPGEVIVRADGRSAASTLFSRNQWARLHARKLDVAAAATKDVTWTLEVQAPGAKGTRTVKLTVPTPPPHWGQPPWVAPVGRVPVAVPEPGPLAERAGRVLNHGIWTLFTNAAVAQEFGWKLDPAKPLLGYQWTILDETNRRHRIFVTRQHGRTEIMLETSSRETGTVSYLTSPSGALEKAWHRNFGRGGATPPSAEASRELFERELGFWLRQVTDTSELWPMELAGGTVLGSTIPNGNPAASSRPAAAGLAASGGPRSTEFLQLPAATAAQRALFDEAVGKIGADEENWAYTETARGLDDKRQTVVRVDPSKPEAERVVLLRVDGKPPTPAQVQGWRDQGKDMPATLGDLPPLRSVIDFSDVRVAADETAAVLFELPIAAGNAAFPADKFQALFRVNKVQRSLEDITVRMRAAVRVAGVVNVTEAGLEARFRTLDPAHPPQPVSLKAGGAARLLFVKISRSFEATRTDYVRVTPYAEPPAPGLVP